MSTPAIIWLSLMAFSALVSANQHGKPNTCKKNFWDTAMSLLISSALLYWGGFFSVVH